MSRLVMCGNVLFRRRNLVFPLFLIALLMAFPPDWHGANEILDRRLDLAGSALVLCGQAVRAAVIGFAYIKRGGLNKRVYAAKLVTEGLFGISRNPLYLGNLLAVSGLLVIHGNPWAFLLGMGFFLFAYASIVAAEESFLRDRFGAEFEKYCQRVPRWWPDFRRLSEATRGIGFNWRRVIIKDYSTVGAWLSGALVLLAYEQVYFEGLVSARPELAAVAALLALLALAMLAIRRAKKTGRLKERAA